MTSEPQIVRTEDAGPDGKRFVFADGTRITLCWADVREAPDAGRARAIDLARWRNLGRPKA